MAAVFACCMACWAACWGLGSACADPLFSLNDASATEGWVSSPGKAKRGAGICWARAERSAGFRCKGALFSGFCDVASVTDVVSVDFCDRLTGVAAEVLKETTTASPSRETWYGVAAVRSITTRATFGWYCAMRTSSTGADTPGITVL